MSQSSAQDSITIEETPPSTVYVALLLGMASISFAPILVRLAQTEAIPSLMIAMSRLLLAALFMTPIVVTRYWSHIRRLSIRDLGLAALAGAFLAAHFISWIYSLQYTSVLVSVVFVTSSPLWVALLEWLALRHRLPRLIIIGLLVAIVGGLIIGLGGEGGDIVDGSNNLLGSGLALLGAIAVAVYLIIGRNIQQGQKLHIIPYIWLVYGIAGIIALGVVLLTRTPITGYSTEGYIWLLAMTIFPQLMGHSSLNYATRYLPATIVSMATQLEPLGSGILAFFIFAELPRPVQILGSAIILAGVMLANYGHHRQQEKLKNKKRGLS